MGAGNPGTERRRTRRRMFGALARPTEAVGAVGVLTVLVACRGRQETPPGSEAAAPVKVRQFLEGQVAAAPGLAETARLADEILKRSRFATSS